MKFKLKQIIKIQKQIRSRIIFTRETVKWGEQRINHKQEITPLTRKNKLKRRKKEKSEHNKRKKNKLIKIYLRK